MSEITLCCPECESDQVAVTDETMFMANSREYYCNSVKAGDSDAKATCLICRWTGQRADLKETQE